MPPTSDLNPATADMGYSPDALAERLMLNSCCVGVKSDELLASLQLALKGLEIGLAVI